MIRYRYSRSRGFTLVELLVSSVILGLSLVTLSQLYMGAMWTYQKSQKLTVGTYRAQYELEKVQNLGFEHLINGVNSSDQTMEDAYLPTDYTFLASKMGVSFTINDLPGGRGTVTWAPYPSGTSLANCHMLQVTVDVYWDGMPIAQSRVHLVTFCTEGYK